MSTMTFSPLPATRLRLPQFGAVRRALAALTLAAALAVAAFAVTTSPLTSQLRSSVRIQTATSALHRAAGVDPTAHSGASTARAVLDRAGCWRQAHRSGSDPSACESSPGR